MSNEERPKPRCFLAVPYSPKYEKILETIQKSVEEAGFKAVSSSLLVAGRGRPAALPGRVSSSLLVNHEQVAGELARADCVIADVTGNSPDVFFEIGLARAMGKALFLLVEEGSILDMPFEQLNCLFYENSPTGLSELSSTLSRALRGHRRSPHTTRALVGAGVNTPFFVDWNRLDRADAENLCRELLAQMGFQKLDWNKEKEIPDIDLIAELPKKDPDGFEYRELWLIALGRNAPPQAVLERASFKPDYYTYSILRHTPRGAALLSRDMGEFALTLLIIPLTDDVASEELREMQEHFSRRRFRESGLRIRVWDRTYLTSLVQQFPQIGYKYFSDEARSRSTHRKTAEELYNENVALTDRLTSTVTALEDEKNKRVRAERDAIWKDISFSAAHRIGNPLFAIETYLDPLERRVKETRTDEAVEVLGSVRETVEKAKAIVEQFKSLARAQKIEPTQTVLRPLLEKACQMAKEKAVECKIECPPELTVYADPVRLTECFDELFSNATHWFDKQPNKIQIQVIQPAPQPLPQSVDSSQQYTLIKFSDNGKGVALEDKNKIFDAFVTNRTHGTGLGLALVRRVIEGHGGYILEDGIPGQGATFEIYLPLPPNGKTVSASAQRKGQKKRRKK